MNEDERKAFEALAANGPNLLAEAIKHLTENVGTFYRGLLAEGFSDDQAFNMTLAWLTLSVSGR